MSDKITPLELKRLFPHGLPEPLMKLIFPDQPQELTVGDIRKLARAIANTPAVFADCRHYPIFENVDDAVAYALQEAR